MTRAELLNRIAEDPLWDILVIGGGASGLGIAVDAASRGYRTVLLEQHDLAKGTSCRSTKLIHGGIRYLRQGNLPLVMEALRERGILRQNAPHLVRDINFIIPVHHWFEEKFYASGLKMYDMLSGQWSFGRSRILSRAETMDRLPTVAPEGLRGGILYHDGQFDDARMAVTLARTLVHLGGTPITYLAVTGLLKRQDRVIGVQALDLESNTTYRIRSRVVINATGVFVNQVRQMSDAIMKDRLRISRGAHIVLDRSFLPGQDSLMIPRTDDDRVLFAIPWLGNVLVGTTETSVHTPELEPIPSSGEIDFLLRHAARHLIRAPMQHDILSMFAGLRPLVNSNCKLSSAALSREHAISVDRSGLISIIGGKWTTYRRMGQDTVDRAIDLAGLKKRTSSTERLRLHGWQEQTDVSEHLSWYGSESESLIKLEQQSEWAEQLHPTLPYLACQVIWAVRHEFARTLEDVLARRTRALFLNARASIAMAPRVAQLMAAELGRDQAWQLQEVTRYTEVAAHYLPADRGQ